jgi:hypothetical protein
MINLGNVLKGWSCQTICFLQTQLLCILHVSLAPSKWVSSVGKSGGILCGVREETLQVWDVKIGKYSLFTRGIKRRKKVCGPLLWYIPCLMKIINKNSWLRFLPILMLLDPYIFCGDFNILRHILVRENKQTVLPHPSHFFNSVIHTINLRGINISVGCYTWSIIICLLPYRSWIGCLCHIHAKTVFPLVSIRKVVRELSDHNLLFLDSSCVSLINEEILYCMWYGLNLKTRIS